MKSIYSSYTVRWITFLPRQKNWILPFSSTTFASVSASMSLMASAWFSLMKGMILYSDSLNYTFIFVEFHIPFRIARVKSFPSALLWLGKQNEDIFCYIGLSKFSTSIPFMEKNKKCTSILAKLVSKVRLWPSSVPFHTKQRSISLKCLNKFCLSQS